MTPLSRRNKLMVTGLLMLVLYAVIDASIRATAPWQSRGAAGTESLDAVVVGLFDTHVLAFEILGVLLTAAMIGAMVIARPLGGRPDSENYTAVSEQQLEATQAASDLTRGVYQTTPTPVAPIVARNAAAGPGAVSAAPARQEEEE